MFKDKTILITGGTGSFGSTVLIYFLKQDVKEIRNTQVLQTRPSRQLRHG